MKVVVRDVSQCKDGDILASDVFNDRGVIFASKETVINEYIKKHFINHGIKSVNIFSVNEEASSTNIEFLTIKNNYKETVLATKGLLQDLTAGKPLSMNKVQELTGQVYQNIDKSDNVLKCLGEIRNSDEYTYTHCLNTAMYAMMLAKWLELETDEIKVVIQAGLLHDIGKTKIPKDILNKSERLSDEEFAIIKQHTLLGYKIVQNNKDLNYDIKEAILMHHERIDGSGYPMKATYDRISLCTRIIAVADVFDAMTSDRAYKSRVTPFDAFEMFQTSGISLFDAALIKAFLNGIAAYLVGSKVQLSNGQTGEIVYIPLNNLSYPIINVESILLDLSRLKDLKVAKML